MKDDIMDKLGGSKAETHFWLTQGMAKAIGVSITDQIARGNLSRAEFQDMVVRCGACEFPERCVRWMAEGQHRNEPPPGYCLNHERLEQLKALDDATAE